MFIFIPYIYPLLSRRTGQVVRGQASSPKRSFWKPRYALFSRSRMQCFPCLWLIRTYLTMAATGAAGFAVYFEVKHHQGRREQMMKEHDEKRKELRKQYAKDAQHIHSRVQESYRCRS